MKSSKEAFDTRATTFPRSQRLVSMAPVQSGRLIRRGSKGSKSSKSSLAFERPRNDSTRYLSDEGIGSQDVEQHKDICEIVMDNVLLIFVLLSVLAGFALGAILDPSNLSARQLKLLRLPGEMFERFLLCVVVPLSMTSIVSAVGGRPTAQGARLTLRALTFFMLTTVWSSLCGLVLAILIKPGIGAGELPPYPKLDASMGIDSLLDILRNMIPDNFVEAFILLTQTTSATSNNTKSSVQFDRGHPPPGSVVEGAEEAVVQGKVTDTNVCGLLFFSLMVGFALSRSSPAGPQQTTFSTISSPDAPTSGRARTNMLLRVCRVLSLKFMRMSEMTLWYTPFAVSVLIAADMSRVENLSRVLYHLGLYAFTVLLGLSFHGFLFLPILYLSKVRSRHTSSFFLSLVHPLAIAFGTSSSLAASPVAMASLEKKVGLDPDVVRLVIPLGAGVNRNGTVLYGTVAAMFAAQLQGAEMDFVLLITLVTASCVATVGLYGLPPAYRGAALTALLLAVMGLPSDQMGYMTVVHWFLDRFCSMVNLMGDCVVAAILHELPPNTSQDLRSLSSRKASSGPTALKERRSTVVISPPLQRRPRNAAK